MKNSNKYFAFNFTIVIILTLSLLVILIQKSNATVSGNIAVVHNGELIGVQKPQPIIYEDNYLLFDTILPNKYETLKSTIDYNTIYDTIEL